MGGLRQGGEGLTDSSVSRAEVQAAADIKEFEAKLVALKARQTDLEKALAKTKEEKAASIKAHEKEMHKLHKAVDNVTGLKNKLQEMIDYLESYVVIIGRGHRICVCVCV